MKKAAGIFVLFVGLLCLVFFAGMYFGRASIPTLPETSRSISENDLSRPTQHTDDLININTADVEQLQQLPGIGSVLAQRIVDYRTENGPFRSILHLQNVEGIGQKTLENIVELICLEDQP